MSERANRPADGPHITGERVLLRVFVQSYLATAHEKPHRRARAFLREAKRLLTDEESLSVVLPIRAGVSDKELSAARLDAIAMYQHLEPIFVAALPQE